MPLLRLFARTEMATECDACRVRFDLMSGGVCESCKRILCFNHLHGSWLHRLRTEFGGRYLCVDCRHRGGAAR
jgi:hypothetical protein